MRPRRLLRRLLPPVVLVTLIVLYALGAQIVHQLRQLYHAETSAHLTTQALLIARELPHPLRPADGGEVDALCKVLGAETHVRVTVILASGKVIGDSEHDPATMDNHADRPEVAKALSGEPGAATRHSFTLGQDETYVGVPVREQGRVAAVVRTAVPVSAIEQTLADLRNRIILVGLLIAAGVVLAGALLAQRLARPLTAMAGAARRFAQGELDFRVPPQTTTEAVALAEALNEMAARLDEQIRDLVQQRNEREALLAGMVEGVLAVDSRDRIMTMNRAAGELFGADPERATGRTLQETIRNPALQRLAAEARSAERPVETEIRLQANGERYLQGHGTLLQDAVLIVLNDVTRLRRLENMRRDFVANVSHELRTPVTSIKGFVETLSDGALDSPEDARRFVGIIRKHADRLAAIIEDLLTLSRLEEDGAAQMEPQATAVRPVLAAAIEACQLRAAEKGVTVELACHAELTARASPELLEQAVINLIDNAVKYSPRGSRVRVEGQQTNGEVVVRVKDEGCGISVEDQERVFERFYRVDRARSRDLGGTGLGLAIVKHIAQVHGGRVGLESALGKGSTFSIYVPGAG
ncbi:MAG: HAMP domain-containing protein [Armatimonadetes bacterium]|nr:HAMP domain-containing protein [Armatimonadota bacterium]